MSGRRRGTSAAAALLILSVAGSAGSFEPVPTPPVRHSLIGGTILVAEFHSTIENPSCGETGCAKLVTDAVMESLRRRGMAAVRDGEARPSAVLEGEIVSLDEGNRASRYFYGGGASKVALRGRVLDASGQLIGAFEDSREKRSGKFGGDSDDLLKVTVHAVAEAIADRIATGQY